MSRSAPYQPFERGVGVRAREAGSAGDGVARGRPEGEQHAVHAALGRRECERRKVEFSSNRDYYYLNPTRESSQVDRNPHQAGDQSQAEGDVRLALGRALAGPFQREPVVQHGAATLGEPTEVLRGPDSPVVDLAVQPGEHSTGAR